jgi:hypothetical protein
MSTQVFTIPRFMLTLGKVATDNMKTQKQILLQLRKDQSIKNKALVLLQREVRTIEKETKKQMKVLEKEATNARQQAMKDIKKERAIQTKLTNKERKLKERVIKTHIVKLNRKISREETSIAKLKQTIV